MNITQAEAIASLYTEFLNSIPREKIPLPSGHQWSKRVWDVNCIGSIHFEDGHLKVEWSRYIGCGENETDTTYIELSQLFD